MKKFSVYLMVLAMCASFTACSGETKDEAVSDDTTSAVQEVSGAVAEIVEVVESLAEEGVVPEVSAVEAKDLNSLELFSNLIDEMYEYFDEVTENEEDMSLLNDSMMLVMLSMKIHNVTMDYVMSGGGDTWERLDEAMANDRGMSDSVMTKVGDVYTYNYANKWNEGYDNVIHMTYDTQARTIDHLFTSNRPNDFKTLMTQFYIDPEGALYISGSDYINNNATDNQYILYYDGKVLNYGIQDMGDVTEAALANDIVKVLPDSWEALLGTASFEKTFAYDGSEIIYVHP